MKRIFAIFLSTIMFLSIFDTFCVRGGGGRGFHGGARVGGFRGARVGGARIGARRVGGIYRGTWRGRTWAHGYPRRGYRHGYGPWRGWGYTWNPLWLGTIAPITIAATSASASQAELEARIAALQERLNKLEEGLPTQDQAVNVLENQIK
jgi:hypothetical protein